MKVTSVMRVLTSLIFLSLIPISVLADTSTVFSPTSCSVLNTKDLYNHISSEVDLRIQGLATTTTMNVFDVRGNSSGGWTRNTDLWTNNGTTSIDWTGISEWNTTGEYERAGVLITPQHVVFSEHWHPAIGDTMTFVDSDNNVVNRTLTAVQEFGWDAMMGVLDSPVPSEITHYPILSISDYDNYLRSQSGLPLIAFNIYDVARIVDSVYLNDVAFHEVRYDTPTDPQRALFYQGTVGGDSGNPGFMIIDGKPVYLFAHAGVTGGTNPAYHLSEVQSIIDTLGGSYDVSSYDLSCFYTIFSVTDDSFSIDENSSIGTSLGFATTTNQDEDTDLEWSITSGNSESKFTINSSSGEITTNDSLDYEDDSEYEIGVTAKYIDAQDISTTTVITIDINDVDEAPILSNQSFSIYENSATGTFVGTTSAQHFDSGQSLTYSILSGDDNNIFSIGSSTGRLEAVDSLNYEATSTFTLLVQVQDSGLNSYTDIATMTISVLDVNESPVADNQTFVVEDDSDEGDVVGIIQASDEDVGQSLSYQIISGNTGNAFSINSSTGQISVYKSSVIDYQSIRSFSLYIKITDNGTPSLYKYIYVTITVEEGLSGGGGGGGGGSKKKTTITDPIATFLSLPPLSSNPTKSELEDRIEILQQVLAKLIELRSQSSTNTSFNASSTVQTFTRDLELGSIGEDVRYLQKLLNSKGFTIASSGPGSPGNETTIFGPATQSALIRFQIANNIYPAVGYFGLISRGYFNR